MAASRRTAITDPISKNRRTVRTRPRQVYGNKETLYERHLLFNNIVDASHITMCERSEAVALSLRAVLSQRWIQIEQTYEREASMAAMLRLTEMNR